MFELFTTWSHPNQKLKKKVEELRAKGLEDTDIFNELFFVEPDITEYEFVTGYGYIQYGRAMTLKERTALKEELDRNKRRINPGLSYQIWIDALYFQERYRNGLTGYLENTDSFLDLISKYAAEGKASYQSRNDSGIGELTGETLTKWNYHFNEEKKVWKTA